MAIINCDLDESDDLFHLLKTLVHLVCSDRRKLEAVKNERDKLLDVVKQLESGGSFGTSVMNEDCRKQMKSSPKLDDSNKSTGHMNATSNWADFDIFDANAKLPEDYTDYVKSQSVLTKPRIFPTNLNLKAVKTDKLAKRQKETSIATVPRQPFALELPSREEKETYFEDEDLIQLKIKTEPNKSPLLDDSEIILPKGHNETIQIEDSQSTQDLFDLVQNMDSQNTQIGYENDIEMTPIPVIEGNAIGMGCPDCDMYHRLIGRDINKNPPRRYGVCSRHRRNIEQQQTPPGFWNPKMQQSDSEETPYDPRYLPPN